MRAILLLPLLLLGAVPAAAESLQQCAAVEDKDARLACYDGLAEAAVAPVVAPTSSKWQVRIDTSPVDDSKNVYLHLVGESGITNRYGQKSDLSLYIACRENVTSAWFVFGGHFMSDLQGRGRVTYRIDKAPAKKQSFTESTDNEALGLWNGGAAIPWIKELMTGQRMYVEAVPYSESAVSDFMPIAGLEEAIKPLRESCAW